MTTRKSPRPRLRRFSATKQSGQSLIELAIVMPLLLLMLTGVVEFGRMAYASVSLEHAVRDGARLAMDKSVSDDVVKQRIVDGARPFSVEKTDITISSRSSGNSVTITVNYTFTSVVPMVESIWGGDDLVLTRSRVARVQD